MGLDIFNTALSGLSTAKGMLATTSHNISNVNNPNYSRQRATVTAVTPDSGGVQIGKGFGISSVERIYDNYLSKNVVNGTATYSKSEAYLEYSQRVDDQLAGGAGDALGLSPALQSFFDSVENVSNDPGSGPMRSLLMGNAQGLVDRFNSLNDYFDDLRREINNRTDETVSTINTLASSIAQLNNDVSGIELVGQKANDLRDQRDGFIRELAESINIQTLEMAGGMVTVITATGDTLVMGTTTTTLVSQINAEDNVDKDIIIQGDTSPLTFTGGAMAGITEFREKILNVAQNGLGRVAIGLSETFNEQHKLGQDIGGSLGTNFFKPGSTDIIPNPANAGGGAVSSYVTTTTGLTASDYTLTFNGGNSYTLTRQSDSTATAIDTGGTNPYVAPEVDGFRLRIESGATAGDTFVVKRDIISANGNTNNTGTATVTAGIVDVNNLSTSDYRLTYAGADVFNLVRLTDNNTTAINTGGAYPYNTTAVDGMTLTIGSGAATLDKFLIKPTRSFASQIDLNVTDSSRIATASPVRTSVATDVTGLPTNTGTAKITTPTVSSVLQLPLAATMTMTFDTANSRFNVVGGTPATLAYNPATQAGGVAFTVNGGITFTVSGTPANGDVLEINNNTNSTGDNLNSLALAQLRSDSLLDGGSSTYQGAYAEMVSNVGGLAKQAQGQAIAQESILEIAKQAHANVSAVNLDEEAADLLRFQQAYSASAKIIGIANSLFQTVLSSIR